MYYSVHFIQQVLVFLACHGTQDAICFELICLKLKWLGA
jgi:hypothetical protein